MITKMWWGHLHFLSRSTKPEKLSFLMWCILDFIKIMVPGSQMGPQLGKTFKLHKFILEKIFFRIGRPISIKLDYPCMKGIQVCLVKGTVPHQRDSSTSKRRFTKMHE
jgi:hypothetical protein